MVPGVHFLHVSIHFFQVFLSLHLPFFLSFLHFLVENLSLQLAPRIEFSEITTEKTILYICYSGWVRLLSMYLAILGYTT